MFEIILAETTLKIKGKSVCIFQQKLVENLNFFRYFAKRRKKNARCAENCASGGDSFVQ